MLGKMTVITDHGLECLTLAGAATMASEELQGPGGPAPQQPLSRLVRCCDLGNKAV